MMINKMIKGLVLLLVFSGGLKAQNWAANGDRFVYSLLYMGEARYVLYEVEKDTVVAGDTCKLFSSTIIKYVGPAGGSVNDYIRTDSPGPDYFFKTEGDSVYWFDGNQFVFTFPLDASTGFQWEVPQNPSSNCDTLTPPSPDLHQVLGRQTAVWPDGRSQEWLSLQSQGDWDIGGRIYVGVAPSARLYPIWGGCPSPGATAGKPFLLSCHYVSSTGETEFYSSSPDFCNDMLTHNEEPLASEAKAINIFPNPFHTRLFVENPNNAAWTIRIYNMLGQQLLMQQINGVAIDVSSLPKGIHIITIEDSRTGQLLTTEKMMKL